VCLRFLLEPSRQAVAVAPAFDPKRPAAFRRQLTGVEQTWVPPPPKSGADPSRTSSIFERLPDVERIQRLILGNEYKVPGKRRDVGLGAEHLIGAAGLTVGRGLDCIRPRADLGRPTEPAQAATRGSTGFELTGLIDRLPAGARLIFAEPKRERDWC
jgi:hypothetical protein